MPWSTGRRALPPHAYGTSALTASLRMRAPSLGSTNLLRTRLVPATLALAVMTPAGQMGGPHLRFLLAALATCLAAGMALALIPQETSDAFGGYRIYGIVVHGVGGPLWALIGAGLSPEGFRSRTSNRSGAVGGRANS